MRKCISCLNCMKGLMGGTGIHCAVNAQACNEVERCDLRRDGAGRKVAVIGGGAAGLEAARVLALRDFQVTLFEQRAELGGDMIYAAEPPKKDKILWYVQYQRDEMARLGVDVRLNTKATPEDVAALEPYAVLVLSLIHI